MTDHLVPRLAIIGIGLIGSSIARACAQYGVAGSIRLYDADDTVRSRAKGLGLGDVSNTLSDAVSNAELVIICTPVGSFASLGAELSDQLKPGAIVSDVGSVKAQASRDLDETLPGHVHLVPGHPIAGTEKSGPEAGFATLFRGRWCILTPLAKEGADYAGAVDLLTRFWEQLGSRVEVMDAERHDLVLAITSHLPHLIAFNIVTTAADMESVDEGEVVKYSAGGFRDFTRIAASDPVMWRDVFLHNKDAVLEALGRFTEDLTALQKAIRWGKGDELFALFERARGIRQSVIDAGQDSDVTNFGRDAD